MKQLVLQNLKIVLLDMDGVVVDSMRHHAEVWKHVLNAYGLEAELMDIYRREGMSGINSVKDIYAQHGKLVPGDDLLGEMLSQKHAIFEGRKIFLYPVAVDIIKYLKSRNIRLGLVTGSMRRSINHLIPRDILSYFDVIVADDDVTMGKPNPDPYLSALRKINGSHGDTLVIENAPFGIKSAKAAGLVCYAVETTLPEEHLMEADMIFKDHSSLYYHLKEIF